MDPSSPGQAELAVTSTLAALAELVGGKQASDLASQLPFPFREPLDQKSEENPGNFSLEEFYGRIAEREEVETATASLHAAAVINTLKEAVSGGELEDIRQQLPEEFKALFR